MPGTEHAERALGADLTRAFSGLEPPPSPPPLSPTLDLDVEVLPPLDDFSSVEEALSGTLDLAALELPLNASLSPCPEPSDSSVSSRSLGSPSGEVHHVSAPPSPSCCSNVRAALDEVSARLKAASSENAALRSRVANLVRENRNLRASLDVAQKQAQANPVLLGLAQVSAEAAGALASALNGVGALKQAPPGKKRKRSAAGKTLACLVLMCGFFFGSPGVIGDSDRTEPNLPAVWANGKGKVLAPSRTGRVITPAARGAVPPVRPSLCLRTLEQLPPPELASSTTTIDDAVVDGGNKDMVRVVKKEVKLEAALEPSIKKQRTPSGTTNGASNTAHGEQFSYVMCRDAGQAVDNVAECQRKLAQGKECGPPHEIKLIMPAAALRGEMDDMSDERDDEYAEVKCNIVSVTRIPAKHANKVVSGVTAARMAMQQNTAAVNHHAVLPVSQ